MKELVLLFFVVGMAVVVALIATAIRLYKVEKKGWHMHREETMDSTEIWLVKGKNTHFCGRALRSAPTYTDKLMEIEAGAQDKMYEWNAANRVSRSLYR